MAKAKTEESYQLQQETIISLHLVLILKCSSANTRVCADKAGYHHLSHPEQINFVITRQKTCFWFLYDKRARKAKKKVIYLYSYGLLTKGITSLFEKQPVLLVIKVFKKKLITQQGPPRAT